MTDTLTRTRRDRNVALTEQEQEIVKKLTAVHKRVTGHHTRMLDHARERAELVAQLRAQGWSIRRIADLIGVQGPTVAQMIDLAERRNG